MRLSSPPARVVVVERAVPRVVVKPASRHAPALDTAPLPEPIVATLAAIATDLRHLPRDAIGDAAELLLWLRRMAGRVDGVAALRVRTSPPRPRRSPAAPAGQDLAQAVFGPSGHRCGATRMVTSRRGRQVAVETRRAWGERGQIELPW